MKKLIFILTVILSASCVFAKKVPAWIDNPYASYKSTAYICAVGSAKRSDDADAKALSDVAAVLRRDVNSVTNAQQFMSSEGENLSSYLADITIQTDVKDISGLSIKERYTDKKTGCYSLAVLDRSIAIKSYSQFLESNVREIDSILLLAEKKPATLDECRYLIRAYKLALENDYYTRLLSVLNPDAQYSFSYGSSGDLAARIQAAFGKITVQVSVRGDSGGRIAAAVGDAVTGFGFSVKYDGQPAQTPYVFSADAAFEDIAKPADSEIYYTRCIVSWAMTESKTGKTILADSENSRQGKLSRSEARQSAVRAAETAVKEGIIEKITQFLDE